MLFACSKYFFSDVVKEGIKIYDTKEFKLAKPRDLSFSEIKKFAEEEFRIHFSKEKYKIGSFQLHQACERYYNAMPAFSMRLRAINRAIVSLVCSEKTR